MNAPARRGILYSMKTNYHTHTYRCKHAMGSDRKYVQAAIDGGFDVLGFSDHCPFPYKTGFISDVRMELWMLDDYLGSIRGLRDENAGKIDIKVGLECEYFPEYIDWMIEMIAEKQLDYVIFGNHNYPDDEVCDFFGHCIKTPEMLEIYLESALRGMEHPFFSYMAHPDLFMRSYERFDSHCERASRLICEKAAKLRLPLEYNISGPLHQSEGGDGFPHPRFWQIAAENGCECIIGYDAHDSKRLNDARSYELYADALADIKRLGLKRCETIRLLR